MNDPKDIFKCRGKFRITGQVIRENPEGVQMVFAKCIPFRAKVMWRGYIEYDALSQCFDELEDGDVPPLYIVNMTTVYDGYHNPIDYVMEFVRVSA
jgi:hypothetical protein